MALLQNCDYQQKALSIFLGTKYLQANTCMLSFAFDSVTCFQEQLYFSKNILEENIRKKNSFIAAKMLYVYSKMERKYKDLSSLYFMSIFSYLNILHCPILKPEKQISSTTFVKCEKARWRDLKHIFPHIHTILGANYLLSYLLPFSKHIRHEKQLLCRLPLPLEQP